MSAQKTPPPPQAAGAPVAYVPGGSSLAGQSDELRNRIRRFFQAPLARVVDEPLLGDVFAQPIGVFPLVDVSESSEEFTVTAELPGMKRGDIHVQFENDTLTIRGEKQDRRMEQSSAPRFHLWERSYGAFQRSMMLPADVDADRIVAEFEDGVLTVHLPKAPESKARGREIEITGKK